LKNYLKHVSDAAAEEKLPKSLIYIHVVRHLLGTYNYTDIPNLKEQILSILSNAQIHFLASYPTPAFIACSTTVYHWGQILG